MEFGISTIKKSYKEEKDEKNEAQHSTAQHSTYLKALLLGLFLLIFTLPQTAWGKIEFTTVPPTLNFGKQTYDGSQAISIDADYGDGGLGCRLLWIDNEPKKIPCKIFGSIVGVPETEMESGNLEITLGRYSTNNSSWHTEPVNEVYTSGIDTRWEYTSDTWPINQAPPGKTIVLPFKGDKEQVTGTGKFPTAQSNYDKSKPNFGIQINEIKLNIPAHCSEGTVNLGINWDIESSP